MAAKDLARQMLAQGLQPSVVAATIGVEDSYISQLMSDEDFQASVESLRVQQSAEDLEYDERLNNVEGAFLERIETKAPHANLQQSLQAFKILNAAKRRKDRSTSPGAIQIGQIVNITMPVAVMPKYLTNAQNEIVEVEGQTMVSATPKHIEEILAKRKPEMSEQVKQLTRKLEGQAEQRALDVLEGVGPVRRQKNSRKENIFDVESL